MLTECGMMPAAFFDTAGASTRLKSKRANSQNVKGPLTKFVKSAPSAHFPKFVLHRSAHLHELRKVMGYSQTY